MGWLLAVGNLPLAICLWLLSGMVGLSLAAGRWLLAEQYAI